MDTVPVTNIARVSVNLTIQINEMPLDQLNVLYTEITRVLQPYGQSRVSTRIDPPNSNRLLRIP